MPAASVIGRIAAVGAYGTDFDPALRTANRVMRSSPPHLTPVLVFMSDGRDQLSKGDPAMTTMQQMYARYSTRGLQVHTIAFGHDAANIPRLAELAAAGGGTFHHAVTGMQLASTFAAIGAGCTGGVEDRLVTKFGEILSSAISLKIMVVSGWPWGVQKGRGARDAGGGWPQTIRACSPPHPPHTPLPHTCRRTTCDVCQAKGRGCGGVGDRLSPGGGPAEGGGTGRIPKWGVKGREVAVGRAGVGMGWAG